MSAPASSDLRELEGELINRAEQGTTISLAEVREMFGVGHDDARAMLDVLREHGKAVEDAPGEWRGPLQAELDAMAAAERAVSAPAQGPPVRVSVPDAAAGEAENPPGWARPSSAYQSVRLTRSMVEALDDEALGKLVRAGVEGSESLFALEVE